MFTDYYAEASCTAGRANFITGEIPLRTGLTTVGQAGADVGLPAQACTLATALKAQGYATGQFGKNHLGDLNKFLPTRARLRRVLRLPVPPRRDVAIRTGTRSRSTRPITTKYGPRSLVHCYATDTDDPTEMPRWGKVGKQKIVDEGPLPPFPDMSNVPNMHDLPPKAKYDMTTFDEVLVKSSSDFMDKAKKDGKPFFVWHNTTRMHVWTFLSQKYKAMQNSQTNYGLEEAGMAQMDDSIGALLKHLDDIGEADNTIVDLHHRQRRRSVHLARRRHDAVQGHQGHRHRRRLPRAVHRPLAGQDQAGHGRERHLLRPRLVPHARGRRRQSRTSPTSS